MQSTEELYEEVKDLISEDEYRARIAAKVAKFEGLLTDEAAALLVVEELGRYKVSYDSISGLNDGQPVRVRAEVTRISSVKEFSRKNNSLGRVVNITISDGSGECRLVLWDDDTQLVSSGALKPGRYLRVINGYAKMTDFGLEISKGRYGAIVVE